jgi:LPXTG-site transpeptidase (sortase) family protein
LRLPLALILVFVASLLLASGVLAASTIITNVDGAGSVVGLYTSIAVNSNGFPVIGYFDDTDNQMLLAICNDLACTAPTIRDVAPGAGPQGSFTSLQLDSSGFIMVSYYEFPAEDLHFLHCDDDQCTTFSDVAIDSANQVGSYTSLALNSAGNGVISYYESGGGGNLKLAVCNDADCTAPTIVTVDGGAEDRGLFTSLRLDADIPVIAYHELDNNDVYLARCSDAACTTATINLVDGGNSVGYDQISLQLDASGFPVMSYYDQTMGALKLAHCSDLDCSGAITINVVDDAGNVGQFSSMKLDGSLPVISYYDATNGALKLAHCADADCGSATIQTVDDAGDVGWDTSLALGSSYVSYYDVTNGDLKFAFVPDAAPVTAASSPAALPETGFPQGRVSALDTATVNYAATDMQLVIPSLNVETDIVSVPAINGAWDVSWLGDQAGLLEGSAFPTWPGNAVLTGHVWDSYDQPGVFAGLHTLEYGDRVEIRAWGQTYVYEVRETELVSALDLSVMDATDDYSWITLITCEGYDAVSGEYWYRRAVSAVLVDVIP